MAAQGEFRVRYWGVSGSFSSPLAPEVVERKVVDSIRQLSQDAEFQQRVRDQSLDADWLANRLAEIVPFAMRSTYGGNTTCIEIETPKALFVLDAGSGFRRLGEDLARRWNAPDYRGDRTGHVLLSHAHMDHTFAIPFVEPFYDRRNSFTLWAPRRVLESLDAVLSPTSALRHVYFPPTYEAMEGIKSFRELQEDADFEIGDIRIRTLGLSHPGSSLAFRLDGRSSSIVFASDHEQSETPDWRLAQFAAGADVLYLDAQYLRSEYIGEASLVDEPLQCRVGWGHSHMEGAVETAVASGVRVLHLGHHDPKRDDARLEEIERAARHLARQLLKDAGRASDAMSVELAREGQSFTLS